MAKDSTKSMTEGKPFSLIMGFALPVFFGLLFQQFYSMVDTMIVGKFLGEDALGAVGATGSLNFLIIGFCTGVCNGFAIPVAHQFGAKKDSNLRRVVANSVWLCLIFAAVMTVITVIFCRNILTFMNTPADLIDDSYKYIVIIFAGIPAVYLYNMVAGIIRSLGDSRTPVYFLALASIINIVLDIVFICLVHTGVEGAAFATVISQAVSGVACVLYMKKKFPILKISKEEWKFDSHWAKTLCSMGIPMGLQYSITAIGSVILQTSVNSLGKLYVTSVTAAQKLAILFWCPYDALGTTMATYAGQNVGAGKLDRIGPGVKTAVKIGLVYSIFLFVVLNLFSSKLLLLFVNADSTDVIKNAGTYILFGSSAYFLLSLVNIIRFSIQGLGFSQFAILAGLFEMIARTIAAFGLVPFIGYYGVCLADPLAWIFADCFLIPAFFRCMRVCLKRMGQNI